MEESTEDHDPGNGSGHSSDWDRFSDLDNDCQMEDCPAGCTHHAARHAEVWYDRTETHALHKDVVKTAQAGCRHCEFLVAAGEAILRSGPPQKTQSAIAQIRDKLDYSLRGVSALEDVPGLHIESYTMITTNRGQPQYDLTISLGMNEDDFARLDYAVTYLKYETVYANADADNDHTGEHRLTQVPQAGLEGDQMHSNAASASNVKFMTDCIERCIAHHVKCTAQLPTRYPRRLLCVADNRIRLMQDEPFQGHYLALSYTWGAMINQAQLTKANLHARLFADEPFDLPPTLQDAVTITRLLGFQYLWIDSMCIVQDDTADKATEITKMHEIYSQAFIVISADGSKDPSSGLFDRAAFVEPVIVTTPDKCLYRLTEISKHGEDSFTAGRAWCFQERVVAQRSLMFTSTETIWECRAGTTCACGRDYERRNNFWTFQNTALIFSKDELFLDTDRQSRSPQVLNGVVRQLPKEYWYRSVERFTRRQITNPDDRMPAISALAKALSKYIEGSYLAGLWEDDFVWGLAWRASTARDTASIDGLSVEGRSWTPSWSWLSNLGPVSWPGNRRDVVTELIRFNVEVPEHHDAYTKVERCVVQLRGPTSPLHVSFDDAHDGELPQSTPRSTVPFMDISMETKDVDGSTHCVYTLRCAQPDISEDIEDCLLLWLTDNLALVLCRSRSGEQQKRRLGLARIPLLPDCSHDVVFLV